MLLKYSLKSIICEVLREALQLGSCKSSNGILKQGDVFSFKQTNEKTIIKKKKKKKKLGNLLKL